MSLNVLTAGNPKHSALILLHGFMGSAQDYAPFLPRLSQDYFCIVPDLPGHGCSAVTTGRRWFKPVSMDLCQLLDAYDKPSAAVVGYSMGGRVALYLACRFPKRVSQLVLESASPGLKTAAERRARRAWDSAITHQLQTRPLPKFLDQWYANPLFQDLADHPKIYSQMLKRRYCNQRELLTQALLGLCSGRQPYLGDALLEMEKPVLVMVGECDRKYTTLYRTLLAGNENPFVRFHVLPNSGHNCHLVNPEAYLQYVLSFLNCNRVSG